MAAITPDTEVGGDALAVPYQGYRHKVFPFIDQTIDNGDTWAIPGGTATIAKLAFEHSGSGTQAGAKVFDATDIVFTASVSGRAGYLHVWYKG